MKTKYKLVPDEPSREVWAATDVAQKPTLEAWILYDATTDKKYIKMDPADGSLAIFDTEEAAMTAKRLNYGTDYERCEYYSTPQPEPAVPVGFCEDTVLSLAERTFSTEVDEQLAEDIIQYARRLHTLYTAPQPSPDVSGLVEIAREIVDLHAKRKVVLTVHVEALEEALAAHLKQVGDL